MLYYNTTTGVLRRYADPLGTGASWADLEFSASSGSSGLVTGIAQFGSVYPGDIVLSWNDGAQQLTIAIRAPLTAFYVFIKGIPYKFTASQTITIPDTEGIWYFYFNSSGVLTRSQVFPDLSTNAIVATVYWDSTSKIGIGLAWEAHGITMDWSTHLYLHHTIGCRFQNGLAIGNYILSGGGASDDEAALSVGSGVVWDEDIMVNIVPDATPTAEFEQILDFRAKIPIWYRNGVGGNWRKRTATNYVVWPGTARIRYNLNTAGTWTQPDVTINGRYMAMWLYATTDQSEPIVAILGQREDTTINLARANNTPESLAFGTLPLKEMKVLWRLIFRTSSTYGNTLKAELVDIVDYRTVSGVPGTYTATDHASLSGRTAANQHPASAVQPDTTNFNHILSVTDDDVQKALDTIDDEAIKKDGSVAFTGDQSMGTKKLTNVATCTVGADAANKDYVDGAVSGHRTPVSVLKMVSDAPQGGAPPVGPTTGDAYVVNTWGGGYTNGDIVEYSGAAWVVIVANSGGKPPNGTRVVVKSVGAAGSFVGKANQIAQYDAAGVAWVFTVPVDGDQTAVIGEASVYENHEYIYDTSVPGWMDFGGSVAHDGTTGKSGPGPQYYHLSQADYNDLTDGGETNLHNHDSRYPRIYTNAGTPEGTVVGKVGDICIDTTGALTVYIKKSGAGNTGWGAV
jgi:hypothetical protein